MRRFGFNRKRQSVTVSEGHTLTYNEGPEDNEWGLTDDSQED